MDRKDIKSTYRRIKKGLSSKTIDFEKLELEDERAFLEKAENTRWRYVSSLMDDFGDRLCDLQLHISLVFQVISLGELSTDISSGKVDVKSIVAFHKRITRAADLVGIPLPKDRSRNKGVISDSDSIYTSSSSSSSSDSDSSTVISRNQKKGGKRPSVYCPPPPPPPPVRSPASFPPGNWNSTPPAPPLNYPIGHHLAGEASTQDLSSKLPTRDATNPPAYTESHRGPAVPLTSPGTSFILNPVSQKLNPPTSSINDKVKPTKIPSVLEDKKETSKHEVEKEGADTQPIASETRLFKSNTDTLGFKLKSLFRSKESLAKEMKNTLGDSHSHLLAFIIKEAEVQVVPHSAFHSLGSTHMRTILTQINNQEWYKIFTSLKTAESRSLQQILHPQISGKSHERDLVVLKVVQTDRLNEWMSLLNTLRQKAHRPVNGRAILAIVREKFVDGKPLSTPMIWNGNSPPPAPRPLVFSQSAPPAPRIRPPPSTLPPYQRTRISDLRQPLPPSLIAHPIPSPPACFPYTPSATAPAMNRGPLLGSNSVRNGDSTPVNDQDAAVALTNHIEYSLRQCDPLGPSDVKTWARVTITQESADRNDMFQRVQTFRRAGGNVIEAKLRLTEQQCGQVTRIMDELKRGERDFRFEWCWDEISLHGPCGEITDFVNKGPINVAATATLMHLIAKRAPKPHHKPLELYNSLTKRYSGPPPIHPGPSPGLSMPNMVTIGKPSPKLKKKYVSDSDSDSITDWSSDSSFGKSRKKLFRSKSSRKGRSKKRYESDSESSEDEDEVMKIRIVLKRGDDVVKTLLEKWTPQNDLGGKDSGNGKASA